MSLGKRLKSLRKERKLRQYEVAKIIGIDETTVSKHENDKSEPDSVTLEKYSSLYSVNVHWLLYGEGEQKLNKNKRIQNQENRDYEFIINEIKERYPDVDIADPIIKKKLMKAIDLVLDDYVNKQ